MKTEFKPENVFYRVKSQALGKGRNPECHFPKFCLEEMPKCCSFRALRGPLAAISGLVLNRILRVESRH